VFDLTSKRAKLEIYLDILKTIKKGTNKPTRIMYRTNLSWKPLMKVIASLIEQGLIVVDKNGSHAIYDITEKGRNVLRYFSKAMEFIKIS
jgi:predicted transcriptional regulator